ncbi:MAG: hypothetical protein AAGH57_02365 [Pseudomonadota bacterium]
MAYLLRFAVFFSFMGLGLWGLAVLSGLWGWIAFIAAFLIGGSGAMYVFKRFATHEQVKADLEARLRND